MRVFVVAAYQFSMYKYRFFESSDLNHAYLTHDVEPIRSNFEIDPNFRVLLFPCSKAISVCTST